jgi:kynurenine 3-monooxygenase
MSVQAPATPRPTSHADALEVYSNYRYPDALAICELALTNYHEMRSGVLSPWFRFQKWLEKMLAPLGLEGPYTLVAFRRVRYSDALKRGIYIELF